MIKFTPVLRGVKNLESSLKAESRRQKRALSTAVRVEGYRLRKLLAKEIRQGAPGGATFAPLSMIARKLRRRTKPLTPLARSVRYYIPKHDPIEMHIGWTGPTVSKSWKRIAEKQQEGFTAEITPGRRRFLIGVGSELGRSKYKPYFMLRRQTRRITTPARPIMEPFWRRYESTSKRNITRNYQAKLRGERI